MTTAGGAPNASEAGIKRILPLVSVRIIGPRQSFGFDDIVMLPGFLRDRRLVFVSRDSASGKIAAPNESLESELVMLRVATRTFYYAMTGVEKRALRPSPPVKLKYTTGSLANFKEGDRFSVEHVEVSFAPHYFWDKDYPSCMDVCKACIQPELVSRWMSEGCQGSV